MAAAPRTTPESAAARERIERILSELDRLPTLPAVVTRLITVTSAGDSSARQVAEIIESDAALTATILKLVRRADLGVRNDAMTAARAVTLLGFAAVRNAALSVQLYDLFAAAEERTPASPVRKEIWRHNLAVACVAEMLGERGDEAKSSGDAFVCGLLHDIGKIAFDSVLPKSFARVVDRVERNRECICDVEREVFGMDHTVAGKRLVTRWRLPQPIVECVWLHHQPSDSLPSTVSFHRLVQIVHLADSLVRREGVGFSGYHTTDNASAAANQLGFSQAAMDAVMDELPRRMRPVVELIGLDAETCDRDYLSSLAKANRELGRLNEHLQQSHRTLELRSRCLEALHEFVGAASAHAVPSEVCAAAITSLRRLFNASHAALIVYQGGDRCLCAVTARRQEDHPRSMPWDPTEQANVYESHGVPMGDPQTVLRRASPEEKTLWDRCVGLAIAEPLWTLPLLPHDEAVGIILIAAEEAEVHPFHKTPDAWQAVASAVSLTLRSAQLRRDLERSGEELLDVNRRSHAARQEQVRGRSLSMIAQMSAGAAHELNNPLSVISGRAQMEMAKAGDTDAAHALQIIVEQAQRATQIVNDLMQFAKPEPPQPVVQSLREVLEGVCQHWRKQVGVPEPALQYSLLDPTATIYGDVLQLRAILDALVGNAVEAVAGREPRIQIHSPSRASDVTCRIVVEDNGVGMTREVLEHAFDPFFSSRTAGRGRGLGLSHAARFAEINGGRVTLESKPGVGAKATIELPSRPPGA